MREQHLGGGGDERDDAHAPQGTLRRMVRSSRRQPTAIQVAVAGAVARRRDRALISSSTDFKAAMAYVSRRGRRRAVEANHHRGRPRRGWHEVGRLTLSTRSSIGSASRAGRPDMPGMVVGVRDGYAGLPRGGVLASASSSMRSHTNGSSASARTPIARPGDRHADVLHADVRASWPSGAEAANQRRAALRPGSARAATPTRIVRDQQVQGLRRGDGASSTGSPTGRGGQPPPGHPRPRVEQRAADLSTHSVGGLTQADLDMARRLDAAGSRVDRVLPLPGRPNERRRQLSK